MTMAARPPDVFVLGVPRAGTTSICSAFALHPELYVCAMKEPHHYVFRGGEDLFSGPGDDLAQRTWVADRDDYARLFRRAGGRRAVDGSTNHLQWPGALEALAAEHPEASTIVVLRDPVERAASAYRLRRWQEVEPLADFGAALAAEEERVAAGWLPTWWYRRLSLYADAIERWQSLFPEEQRLVIRFDDLVADPAATLAEAYRFLGVRDDVALELPRENVGGANRSAALAKILNRGSRWKRTAKDWAPGIALRAWERLQRANARDTEVVVDPIIEDRLREEFAEDVRRTAALTGLDLSRWLP